MIKHDRKLIQMCCDEVQSLVGDAAEIGVWRGYGAKLIASLLPDVTVHLFDTFTGFPPAMKSDKDGSWPRDAWTDTSIEVVTQTLAEVENYSIHQGIFPASADGLHPKLKFVHIDVDLYLSTVDALRWSWQHLIPGGVILCDDYACPSCPGALHAVNEFAKSNCVPVERFNTRAVVRRQ
jgi:O-methyltransferase